LSLTILLLTEITLIKAKA